ncbi:NUDIX domain-containing protein [Streptomyces sp. R44]|uniref:NUDIX domain-containing protein n=1 Tax=Streptomyces sp. R44 TaxID=3238633 RepID=A0AB39TC32_9ACTN
MRRPSRDHLYSTVGEYLARHPGERDTLSGLLTALAGEEDPTSRASLPGHITCSGVVIDADGRVLHIEHKASGLLLSPGGHVETGDETLLAAALRELAEQTGIPPSPRQPYGSWTPTAGPARRRSDSPSAERLAENRRARNTARRRRRRSWSWS